MSLPSNNREKRSFTLSHESHPGADRANGSTAYSGRMFARLFGRRKFLASGPSPASARPRGSVRPRPGAPGFCAIGSASSAASCRQRPETSAVLVVGQRDHARLARTRHRPHQLLRRPHHHRPGSLLADQRGHWSRGDWPAPAGPVRAQARRTAGSRSRPRLARAHFDHLDTPSLGAVRGLPAVVMAASTSTFCPVVVSSVTELRWNESTTIKTRRSDASSCAQSRSNIGAHWLQRDTYRGYNGYIVEREGRRLLIGGDTAATPLFADHRRYGPFEAAVMPVGAYDPWIRNHCTPEQAVAMADAAGARCSCRSTISRSS